jgi:hypothetical protein
MDICSTRPQQTWLNEAAADYAEEWGESRAQAWLLPIAVLLAWPTAPRARRRRVAVYDALKAASIDRFADRLALIGQDFRPEASSQRISGALRGTGVGWWRGWPTMMGATGAKAAGNPSADLPSAVPSQPCAKPIQHVPRPLT